MDEKRAFDEEIEESLRICEELFEENPLEFPEKPDMNIDDVIDDANETEPLKPVEIERGPEPEVKEEPEQEERQQQQQEREPEPEPEQRSVVRTVVNLIVCVLIALTAAILITRFVANHTTVEGSSMESTLQSGDDLVVEKISYLIGKPERFDIVVFHFNEDTNYIKRIIGLPGERVKIEEGKIYINDKPIFDEHGKGTMIDGGIAEETVELGADEYFVLGDNRGASKDSRDEEVGLVKEKQIVGKAWLRVMPFERFGLLS